MSFDYDLVVIGSTREGIYAAKKAALLKARVALVTQSNNRSHSNLAGVLGSVYFCQIAKQHIQKQANNWEIALEPKTLPSLDEVRELIHLAFLSIDAENSLEKLAYAGVDVIYEKGEFCRLPKQAFVTQNRKLISRNYLLATGASYVVPSKFSSLAENDKLFTPEKLWQKPEIALGKKIVVMGRSFRSIELAQVLAVLGHQIFYATANTKLVSGESAAVNRLFLAQLNGDGVKILLNSPLKQVEKIGEQISLQLGARKVVADTAIFADSFQPNIRDLNLESVGIKHLETGVIVNDKLQTSNKSIYACGNLLGGYSLPTMAEYEVDLTLKNIFSFPWFKHNYQYLPKVMLTKPNLGRIGLTSPPKEFINKKEVYVVKEFYKTLMSAHLEDNTTGWCELIVKANGEILGSTIVGDRAVELINLITLMMRHKIKLTANPIKGLLSQDIPYTVPSHSEIFNNLAISFQEAKLQQNKSLRNRLMAWFDWRK